MIQFIASNKLLCVLQTVALRSNSKAAIALQSLRGSPKFVNMSHAKSI